MTTQQADRVLELVVFTLKDGATREQLLATVDAASAWVATQPGFISRDLSYSAEDDKWIDVLYWRTLEHAKAAAAAAESSPSCSPMFALIDMDAMLYLHGAPVSPAAAA